MGSVCHEYACTVRCISDWCQPTAGEWCQRESQFLPHQHRTCQSLKHFAVTLHDFLVLMLICSFFFFSLLLRTYRSPCTTTTSSFLAHPSPRFSLRFSKREASIFLDAYGLSSLQPTDLYSQMVSKNQTLLEEKFGITNGLPFTFILQPQLSRDPLNNILLDNFGVEDMQSHIVFNTLNAGAPAVRCDGLPTAQSLTQDCNATSFDFRSSSTPGFFPPRLRRGGDRRYKTMFGALFDSDRTSNQRWRTSTLSV